MTGDGPAGPALTDHPTQESNPAGAANSRGRRRGTARVGGGGGRGGKGIYIGMRYKFSGFSIFPV